VDGSNDLQIAGDFLFCCADFQSVWTLNEPIIGSFPVLVLFMDYHVLLVYDDYDEETFESI